MLAEVSQAVAPGAHAAVLIDGAGYHIAGDLTVPNNITLVRLPSYSPELNAIEKLWQFMRENKKYWLAPIVITLVLVGVLLVLAKGSAIAPFIYTLF